MLTKKDMKRFNRRRKEYDCYTTEKEVETEFYFLLKQYYTRKYTDIGEGKIKYTAPYNIDGLFEIRTLDSDYRILTEAKSNKDLSIKSIRNEVLCQAIYYCRKLNHYDELLPAIIVLLDKSFIVVIKTDDLQELIDKPYNGCSASIAYSTDLELMKELNSLDYKHSLIKIKNNTKYNKIFKNIEADALDSTHILTKNKRLKIDKTDEILNKFIFDNPNYRFYNNEWYIFENEWVKTSISSIKQKIRKISVESKYPINSYNDKIIISSLQDLFYISECTNIKFKNCILNYKANKIIENNVNNFYYKEFYFNFVKEQNSSKNDFVFMNLEMLLTEKRSIFIETSIENYNCIYMLADIFNKSISHFNEYTGEDIVVYENNSSLKFNIPPSSININDFIVEKLEDELSIEKLISRIINTKNNIDIERMYVENNKSLFEWRNRGDNIKTWFENYLEEDANSFVLMEDVRDSHNYFLKTNGYAEIAYKNFLDRFTNHRIIRDSHFEVSRSRVSKYKQSSWIDPNKSGISGYSPRKAGSTPAHIKGLRFKNFEK